MKNFVLIGAAGFIAPKHMKAIKETGNNLLAALDKNDSVGIIDNYFPEADFFTEFERFDRHIEKLKRKGTTVDYLSVCSPNYLHDAHIRFGLRIGADVICEKPVVLNPWNLDPLIEIEKESKRKVNVLLQLRLHPAVTALKQRIANSSSVKKHNIQLKYITSRGHWYHSSWKGDSSKSGGIATNIGIHFFDMLIWIFGDVLESKVDRHEKDRAAGSLVMEKANVNWLLSINADDLPAEVKKTGKRSFRSLIVDGEEISLEDGFADLHTRSYQEIVEGNGFSMEETKKSIELVHCIRKAGN